MAKKDSNEADFVYGAEDKAPGITAAEKSLLLKKLQLLQLRGKAAKLTIQADCATLDRKLLKLQAQRLQLVQDLDAQIAETEAARLAKAAAKLNEIEEIEAQIVELILSLRESVDNETLAVTYKSHGRSITYDYKLLDPIRDTNPDLWALIADARREIEKKPSIKIEWK